MTRGIPAYFTGSRPTTGGGDQVQNMVTDIRTELNGYLSNGTNAWELYDTLGSAPTENYIYRSVGDRSLVSGAGDAALFFQLAQINASTLGFSMFQDWSTSANSGSRQAGSTTTRWTVLDTAAAYQYWGLVNEYEFVFLLKQRNSFYFMHMGSPIRSHVPAVARGVAFTTAPVSAGASATVTLDRDITGSILDSSDANGPQQVWVYDLTPAGSPLRSPTVELADVQAITPSSITFATLSNSFGAGAIVGLDPCPSFITEGNNLAPGGSMDVTLYFTNSVVGAYSSATTHSADYEPFLSAVSPLNPAPNLSGLIQGSRAAVSVDEFGQGGYRGTMELLAFVFSGDLSDGDFFRANFSTAQQYILFPSLFLGSANSTTPVLALGPGAS